MKRLPEALGALPQEGWDRRHAVHLLNRAGFGVPAELADRLAGMGPAAAVDYLVDFEREPDVVGPPDFLIEPLSPEAVQELTVGLSPEELQLASQAGRRWERENVDLLKAWWLDRMVRTRRPLEEKLTLFWHGHFAVSAQKVYESWHHYALNHVFRENAAGNARALTLKVARSPAMLRYLDNDRNVKNGPNENWAREMLELFVLGRGPYSERDIKELARAFTGWTRDHKHFVYRERQHDEGEKTLFGQTGNFDGWDATRIVYEQPAAAEHLARKLWAFFAYPEPEKELVQGLAAVLRQYDYDLKPMLRVMFSSQAFYSARAMGTQIKSPVQLVVQLLDHLKLDPPPWVPVLEALARLGQDLFYPPNVKGWDGGRAWISAATLTERYNLPATLVLADDPPRDSLELAAGGGMMTGAPIEAVPPEKDPSGAIRQLLAAFPLSQRESVAAQVGVTRPEFRHFIGQWLRAWCAREDWRPARVVGDISVPTVAAAIDELEARYLAVRLAPESRAVLAEAFPGVSGGQFTRRPTEAEIGAFLHLFFATAEYQLC